MKIKIITCLCGGDFEAAIMPIRRNFQLMVKAAKADGFSVREENFETFKFKPCFCKRRPKLNTPAPVAPKRAEMVEVAPFPAHLKPMKVIAAENDDYFNF